MKRLLSLATLMALGCVLGCADTAEVEKKTTITTPGGSTTKTETEKVEKTGDHADDPPKTDTPPPNP